MSKYLFFVTYLKLNKNSHSDKIEPVILKQIKKFIYLITEEKVNSQHIYSTVDRFFIQFKYNLQLNINALDVFNRFCSLFST